MSERRKPEPLIWNASATVALLANQQVPDEMHVAGYGNPMIVVFAIAAAVPFVGLDHLWILLGHPTRSASSPRQRDVQAPGSRLTLYRATLIRRTRFTATAAHEVSVMVCGR